MAAKQLTVFFDTTASVINLQTPTQAQAGRKYLTVIDFVTLNIVNGTTAGEYGVEIYSADDWPLARLVSVLEAADSDTIHVTWPNGLPCFSVSSTVASGTGVTNSYHADQGEALGASSKAYLVPVAAAGDASFYGTIGYHFESRSRER